VCVNTSDPMKRSNTCLAVWEVAGWLALVSAACSGHPVDSAPSKPGSPGTSASPGDGGAGNAPAQTSGGGGMFARGGGVQGGSSTIGIGLFTGGAGSNECQRVVEFTTVKLAEPPPFDVVIVADNSDSLAWSRDDLASGLNTLLADVRGREVRLFVLTATQYGASTETAAPWLLGTSAISWKDPVTGAFYSNAMTEYHLVCTDAQGASTTCPESPATTAVSLTAKGTWQFQMPAPVAELTPAMTQAEFAEQQDLLSNAILAHSGGGAQVEQPLCTLNRYIRQDRSLLPQHAVFLVISDEDDTTDGRNCLVGHTTTLTAVGNLQECATDCDEYRYSVSGPICGRTINFNCVPVDDMGTLFPDQAQAHTLYQQVCDSAETAACTPEQLELSKHYCAPGSVPRDCVAQASETKPDSCFVSRTDANTDVCTTAFTFGGISYANLADYCTRTYGATAWANCERKGYKRTPRAGSVSIAFVPQQLVLGSTTAELTKSFHAQAKVAFEEDGYKVQAIILDPAYSCPVRAGQSYGTNLRELASSPKDVFAICEPYDAALDVIKGFAASLLVSEYPLHLESDEVVESVQITDQLGVERNAGPGGFTHDRTTDTLTIAPGVLTSNDRALAVEVVANCRPQMY
jgi:hypothetical protein